jgi:putative transcriptional regulator
MKPVEIRPNPSWLRRIKTLIAASVLWLFCCPLAPGAAQERFLTGQLLAAGEEMKDPRFVESVVYMVNHDVRGAMGLIINRPMAKGPLEDLLKGLGVELKEAAGEIILHYGGPVSPDQGYILHSDDVLLADSTKIKDGIAMTADVKLLETMAQGKGPRQILFMFGYAGWGPGQLEAELKSGWWFVVPAEKTLIFGKDAEKKWRQAMDRRRTPL